MNAADFLPSFFKQVKRAAIPGQGQVDDYLAAANDPLRPVEWPSWIGGGRPVPLANMLAPEDQKPVVAPAIVSPTTAPAPRTTIPYKVPLPEMASTMPAPEGAIPAPESVAHPGIADATARAVGHVYTDKRGRPKALPGELDPNSTEKTLAVHRANQNYDPEANPAKGWKKWVPTMISGALRGFGAGGVGGAIFGAAEGGIGGAMDPARANREWQRKKLGESAPIVAGIQKDQATQIKNARDMAGLEGTLASTNLANRRAEELGKPKPGQIKENERGEWTSIDPVTKTTSPIMDPVTGKPARAKPTGAKEEWVHDENGIAHKFRDGKDTGLRDPGRNLVSVPGYGLMSPSSARSADAIEGRETAAARERATIASGKAKAMQAESERLRGVAMGHLSNADTLEGQLKQLDPDDDAQKDAADELQKEIQRLRTEALELNTQSGKLITDSKEFEAEATGASGRAKGAGRKYRVDPKYLQ